MTPWIRLTLLYFASWIGWLFVVCIVSLGSFFPFEEEFWKMLSLTGAMKGTLYLTVIAAATPTWLIGLEALDKGSCDLEGLGFASWPVLAISGVIVPLLVGVSPDELEQAFLSRSTGVWAGMAAAVLLCAINWWHIAQLKQA
jgi:hypothetical protein